MKEYLAESMRIAGKEVYKIKESLNPKLFRGPCDTTTKTPPLPKPLLPTTMATTAPALSGPKPVPPPTSLQQQSSAQRVPPQPQQQHTGLRTPSNRKTIYDRNLNRTRTTELSRASFAFLFSEMVTYAQKRVTGIQDLERRCIFPFPQSLHIHISTYLRIHKANPRLPS